MGKVFSYREFHKELQDELSRFEAEVMALADDNGVEFDEALSGLDDLELEQYEWLQRTVEQLKRWESVDLTFGAYRRAERVRA
jgi:hypothetical protein